jgi:hypothetical protein
LNGLEGRIHNYAAIGICATGLGQAPHGSICARIYEFAMDRRLLTRMALQFAQVLFCPFTAGTAVIAFPKVGGLHHRYERSFL